MVTAVAGVGDGSGVDDGSVGNNPALCGSFSACGGDPAGSWSLAGFCIVDDDRVFDECPGVTIDRDLSQSGSLELNSDNTYQLNNTTNSQFTLVVPGSCLTGVDDCRSIEPEDEPLVCSGDPTSSCTCSSEDTSVAMTTGTWAVSGNTIEITSEDGTDSFEFCVEGDTLTLGDDEGSVTRFTR